MRLKSGALKASLAGALLTTASCGGSTNGDEGRHGQAGAGGASAGESHSGGGASTGGIAGGATAGSGGAGDAGASESGGGAGGRAPTTGGAGGGTSTGPIALDDLADALTGTYCAALVPCCAEASLPLTDAQCRATFQQIILSTFEQADPDNYSYDSVLAGECVGRIREAAQTGACGADFGQNDLLCEGVFDGVLAPGEPCRSSVECARLAAGDERSCDEDSTGTSVCVIERRVGEGDPCYWTCRDAPGGLRVCSGSGTGERPLVQGQCFENDGLYCTSSGVCEKQADVGQPCSGGSSCIDPAHCDFTSGLCAAPVTEGQSCTTDDACQSGLFCSDGLCAPELPPGAPCEPFDECREGSCDNGVCVEASGEPGADGVAFLCNVLAGSPPAP